MESDLTDKNRQANWTSLEKIRGISEIRGSPHSA